MKAEKITQNKNKPIKYPKSKKRNYNEMKKSGKTKSKDKNKKIKINSKFIANNPINSNNKMIKLNIDNDYIKNNKIYLHPNSFILNEFNINENMLEIEEDLNYNISVPSNKEMQNYIDKSENNYLLYYKIINHLNIEPTEFIEKNINKDGNCFFNNISYFFTNTEDYHLFFRYILYKYCKYYLSEITNYHPLIDYKGKTYSTINYINLIKNTNFYAGDLELSQCIFLYNINIVVYEKIYDDLGNLKEYKFIKFYQNDINDNKKFPLAILAYEENGAHYQHLIYKSNIINNFKFIDKKEQHILKEDTYK